MYTFWSCSLLVNLLYFVYASFVSSLLLPVCFKRLPDCRRQRGGVQRRSLSSVVQESSRTSSWHLCLLSTFQHRLVVHLNFWKMINQSTWQNQMFFIVIGKPQGCCKITKKGRNTLTYYKVFQDKLTDCQILRQRYMVIYDTKGFLNILHPLFFPLLPIFGRFLSPCIPASPSSHINSGPCSCGKDWLLWVEIRYFRKRFSPFHSDLARTHNYTLTKRYTCTRTHRHLSHIQFNYVSKKWFLLQRENVFSSVLSLRLSISAS